MSELTHAQILAIVEAGASVVWRGRVIHRAADVPTDEEIAAADAVAGTSRYMRSSRGPWPRRSAHR